MKHLGIIRSHASDFPQTGLQTYHQFMYICVKGIKKVCLLCHLKVDHQVSSRS